MDVKLDLSVSESKFDWIVRSRAAPSQHVWDVPLLETASFVVIPSLGSLVPGWVLVIPRVAATNFAKLTVDQRHELFAVRDRVVSILKASFDDEIFEFEHGPAQTGSLLGCGVEQAHLHIAPLPFDLVDAVEHAGVIAEMHPTSSRDPWGEIDGRRDYWMVRNLCTTQGTLVHPTQPVSQGIRKIIAERTGQPRAWNYRDHPHEENVNATVRAFSRIPA